MSTKRTQNTPSKNEDEYFAKQDAELIKTMRDLLDKERSMTERRQHWMKCPKCGADLREEEHHKVKVDVCPECQGVWLDAGELDLIRQMNKSGGSGVMKGLLDLFPGKSSSRK